MFTNLNNLVNIYLNNFVFFYFFFGLPGFLGLPGLLCFVLDPFGLPTFLLGIYIYIIFFYSILEVAFILLY